MTFPTWLTPDESRTAAHRRIGSSRAYGVDALGRAWTRDESSPLWTLDVVPPEDIMPFIGGTVPAIRCACGGYDFRIGLDVAEVHATCSACGLHGVIYEG